MVLCFNFSSRYFFPSPFLFHPLIPVQPCSSITILFPLQRENHPSTTFPYFCLTFVIRWVVACLSKTEQLKFTCKKIHNILLFLGVGYVSRDDIFFLVPSIYLPISWFFCFNTWVRFHCINAACFFLYHSYING